MSLELLNSPVERLTNGPPKGSPKLDVKAYRLQKRSIALERIAGSHMTALLVDIEAKCRVIGMGCVRRGNVEDAPRFERSVELPADGTVVLDVFKNLGAHDLIVAFGLEIHLIEVFFAKGDSVLWKPEIAIEQGTAARDFVFLDAETGNTVTPQIELIGQHAISATRV
jgi:hypothetical protein